MNTYLDDLVIISGSSNEHLQHLELVLKRFSDAGLTVNLKKCHFGVEECTYLGHTIGHGRTSLEQAKVEQIRNYPVPTDKKGVRTYLGLTGYYRLITQPRQSHKRT